MAERIQMLSPLYGLHTENNGDTTIYNARKFAYDRYNGDDTYTHTDTLKMVLMEEYKCSDEMSDELLNEMLDEGEATF